MQQGIYFLVCMILAYSLYKPNQKKLFIGASWWYAIFVSAWFCIFTWLLVWPVWQNIRINYQLLPLFIVILIVWLLSPYLVRKFGKEPHVSLSDAPARLLIRFEPKMFLTKFFEILFQQSMFVYVLFVILHGLPFWHTILWFTIFIGLIHLANLPFTGKKDTLFYFYLSLPMAILFGILILKGYLFVTITIHMLFYLVFNGRYWFTRKKDI